MADDFLRRVLIGDADAIEDAIASRDIANVNRQLAVRHYPAVETLESAAFFAEALRTIVELVERSKPPPAKPLILAAIEAGRDVRADRQVA